MTKIISNKIFYKKYLEKMNDKGITGKAVFTFCRVVTQEAKDYEKRIMEASKNGTWEEYRKLVDEFHSKFKTREIVIDNLVTRAGRTVLARILKGDTTYTGIINYCVLGTGADASTTSQTQLVSEKYRKQISSSSYTTYTTYISTFFSASECSGTYKEISHNIDGTASANSGQMFSRIADPETAELPITKGLSESLTIDYSVSL